MAGGAGAGGVARDSGVFDEVEQTMIEMTVQGRSCAEIAEATGRSRQAIWKRLQQPRFRMAIQELCQQTFEARIRALTNKWDLMQNAFTDILDDPEANHFAKIAAATQLKSIMLEGRNMSIGEHLSAIQDRLKEVERAAGVRGHVTVVDDDDFEDEDDGPESQNGPE
jgi:hypothetical protein